MIPHTPNGNAAEPQMRGIKAAPSAALCNAGAYHGNLGRSVEHGRAGPAPPCWLARAGGSTSGPRRAHAITRNGPKAGEPPVYKKGAAPAAGGKTRLSTAAELKGGHAKTIPRKRLENAPNTPAEAGAPKRLASNRGGPPPTVGAGDRSHPECPPGGGSDG